MSNSRGKNKARGKRRTKKISKGINAATKHPLDEVQKVLIGKGIFRSFKPLGHERAGTEPRRG